VQSELVERVFCAPGNGGTGGMARNVPIPATDVVRLVQFAKQERLGLIVLGPESAVDAGAGDALRDAGFNVFGPNRGAGRIETSKSFAKSLMRQAGIPTADFETFTQAAPAKAWARERQGRVAVKADGLARGKGVIVCGDTEEADGAIDAMLVEGRFGKSGATIVVEERLDGPELSLLAVTDGTDVVPLAPARDYKRVRDGDAGPNTGGMGSISPVPGIDSDMVADILARVHRPVVNELARRVSPYRCCLYAGLILTADGPKVIEFNARFGDPETQAILPRTGGDLLALLARSAAGSLAGCEIETVEPACVSVVVASRGYPDSPQVGDPISGIDDAEEIEGVTVFHAGTANRGDGVQTSGGRVLNVTAVGPDFHTARRRAYLGVDAIRIAGAHHRSDIGLAAQNAEHVHA